jgi:hypothetical protein
MIFFKDKKAFFVMGEVQEKEKKHFLSQTVSVEILKKLDGCCDAVICMYNGVKEQIIEDYVTKWYKWRIKNDSHKNDRRSIVQ